MKSLSWDGYMPRHITSTRQRREESEELDPHKRRANGGLRSAAARSRHHLISHCRARLADVVAQLDIYKLQ
jgi:hypothetical protein